MKWIKSATPLSEALRLLEKYPTEKMNGFPVCEEVNNGGLNDVSLVNPSGAKIQLEVQQPYIRMGHKPHKEKGQSGRLWVDGRLPPST